MAREYVLSGENLTLANQPVTLAFINPGATMSLEILRMWVGQVGTATSAQIRLQVVKQVSAFPTLVSATPRLLKDRDPVSAIVGGTAGAAGTCGINASAEGAGAKTVLLPDAFNNLTGWHWVTTPQDKIVLAAGSSSGLGIFLPAAPGTLTGWAVGLIYKELG